MNHSQAHVRSLPPREMVDPHAHIRSLPPEGALASLEAARREAV